MGPSRFKQPPQARQWIASLLLLAACSLSSVSTLPLLPLDTRGLPRTAEGRRLTILPPLDLRTQKEFVGLIHGGRGEQRLRPDGSPPVWVSDALAAGFRARGYVVSNAAEGERVLFAIRLGLRKSFFSNGLAGQPEWGLYTAEIAADLEVLRDGKSIALGTYTGRLKRTAGSIRQAWFSQLMRDALTEFVEGNIDGIAASIADAEHDS